MAMDETPIVMFTSVTSVSKLNKIMVTLLNQGKTKIGLDFRYNRTISLDNPLLTLVDCLGIREKLFTNLKLTSTNKIIYCFERLAYREL
jgi:hypothetical protein